MTRVMTRNYTRNPPFHVRKKFQKWMKICSHLSSIFAPWKLRRRFSSGPAVKCGNSSRTNGNVFRFLHNLGRIYTHTHTHKYRQISFFFSFSIGKYFCCCLLSSNRNRKQGRIHNIIGKWNKYFRERALEWVVGGVVIGFYRLTYYRYTSYTNTHRGISIQQTTGENIYKEKTLKEKKKKREFKTTFETWCSPYSYNYITV